MIRRPNVCMIAILLTSIFYVCSASASNSKPNQKDGYATYYTAASCQAEGTSGVYTANGEKFNESDLTCAMPKPAKFGEKYKVTNPDNGKSIIVRCNDRGPGKKARSRGVVIDLTPTGFTALGCRLAAGRVLVRVELLEDNG